MSARTKYLLALAVLAVLALGSAPAPAQVSATVSAGAEVTEAADCSSYVAEGDLCWDTDDDVLYIGDGAAATAVGPGAGSVAADAIFDAAGDLVQGTGANTSARLAIGAANKVLKSSGTAAAWSTETYAAPGATGAVLCSDGTNWARCTSLDIGTVTLPNGTAAAPTTEAVIYHNNTTDVTTVGNGTSADRLLMAQGIGVSKVGVITKAADYTLGTDSADEAYGYLLTMTATGTVTLPAVVIGMSVCVYSTTAAAVHVDPNASDKIRLTGTGLLDDGDKISSASAAGDFICLIGESADGWVTLGRGANAWTDGG